MSCWWWGSFFVLECCAILLELWGYLLTTLELLNRSAEADECQADLQASVKLPAVDVFITVCNEPLALVWDTIRDVLRMAETYTGVVKI